MNKAKIYYRMRPDVGVSAPHDDVMSDRSSTATSPELFSEQQPILRPSIDDDDEESLPVKWSASMDAGVTPPELRRDVVAHAASSNSAYS